MNTNLTRILPIVMLLSLSSCAVNAPVVGSGKVSYGDSNAVETVNTDFGSTDLNMVASQMATALITSGKINQCKTYTVSKVRNKTDQYIDTENITQSIVNNLSNSAQVKSQYVLSSQEMQSQVDELDRQNQSGLYDQGSTAKLGKMQGAQCRLDGYVSNITKDNGQVKDVFYVFNMKLIDVQQGTQLWSNEKQIRKDMTK
ncbi:penicillin-binding protein activator LpoB [Aquella oligotrophica]|uniref:Penicillin-binding protein activator LpoB n=1 Tax=Aquella oligotrophica TaxID=2067065 RepID=A0A2I7N3W0_9NEIS|nr:penicillin-binding protein activator LpoB [Aquella oligotrophica]AUR50905.1 penicillin-binding protein activator LpoB [Aquella oligotrophica]